MKKSFFSKIGEFVKNTDYILLLLCIIASSFGILLVYSATLPTLEDGQIISGEFKSMLIAVPAGIIASIIISAINSDWFAKFFYIIGAVSLLLMAVTLIFGVAPDLRQDSRCWLKFGSFYFQPSELVKIGFVITFAVHLETVKDRINSLLNVALLGVHALIPIALVVKTGDAGSALVFAVIVIGMLIAAGLHWLYFLVGAAGIVFVVPLAWKSSLIADFQKSRILSLFLYDEPEYVQNVAYQQNQAINAIGSGGWTGKGLFNGDFVQSGSIPEAKNDMILSVAGEELGFIGAFAVLAIITAIVIRIFIVSKKASNGYGRFMAIGIGTMIIGQTLINVGMCLRMFPVIGITLPFFSAGGSSNLCVYVAIGLVMSIWRNSRKNKSIDYFYKPINYIK